MGAGASEARIVPGLRLDGYELLCPLGEGGMASVWIARLLRKHGFEKLVAIKMILPKFASDPTFQKMFLDEARLASRIDHVNVAHIHDLGERDGLLYLVMELIDGDALTRLRKAILGTGDPFPIPVALRIMADVCAGLHAAHELSDLDGQSFGVVHRDVSPQNVLISGEGVSKLIDFGVAKAANRLVENTNSGYVKGKVQYMAPEQALGKAVDRRADTWAVGAVLYHLVSTRPPFEAENQLAMLHLLESGAPPSPLPPHVPRPVVALISRALSHTPGDRFQSADEMRAAIEATGLAGTASDVAAALRTYLSVEASRRRELLKSALRGSDARRSDPEIMIASAEERSETAVRVNPRPAAPVATVPLGQRTLESAAPNPRVVARTVAMPSAPQRPLEPLESPDMVSRSGVSRSGVTPIGRRSSPNLALATRPRSAGPALAIVIGVLLLGAIGAAVALRYRTDAKPKRELTPPAMSSPSAATSPAIQASGVAEAPPSSVPDPSQAASTRTAPRPATSAGMTPLARAHEAAMLDDHAGVRRHLEARVRRGRASQEEVSLVIDACKAMNDDACVKEIQSLYPLYGRE